MYKEFYGFTTYPFAVTPDPQLLYLSTNHAACLRSLLESLERGHGLIVLTGETGTGKTLLLRHLVQSLGEKTHVAFLVNSSLNALELLLYTLHELTLDVAGKSKFELLTSLKNFLLTAEMTNEKVVIIIDEAQNLAVEVLEDLRLLTNFESSERTLLQIVLAGQPALEDTLRLPELAQLNQRIGAHCCLTPMNYDETKSYIADRLRVAGATDPVFTSEAIEKIFLGSAGVPRVINVLCDYALCCGFSHQERTIGDSIVQQVVQELHVGNVEQVAQHQRQGKVKRTKRLACIAGIVSLSLLGVGFVLQAPLSGNKSRAHAVRSVASPLTVYPPSAGVREQPLLPYQPGVREQPLLPRSPGVDAQPRQVQWVQTTLAYQLPTGTPLTVPLPQLRRIPEDLPVRVTLDAADSTPAWLTFDPNTLALSGTAPLHDRGKTYHLTFRAATTDGLASLLRLVLTLRGQAGH